MQAIALRIVAKLMWSLCLFDAIVESHAMNEKKYSMHFSLEVKVDFKFNKGQFNPRLMFSICSKDIYHIKSKNLV